VSFVLRLYERFRVLIHEAAKFGVVGLAGFIVSLGGADILHFDANVGKYKAVVVATIAATVVTFLGNRYWAFRHRERVGMGRETVLFFVFNAIGLLIQLACVAIVADGANLQGKVWYNLANLTGIGLGTLFRFWSYRKWVWRTQEPAGEVPATGHRPVAPAPGFPEAGFPDAGFPEAGVVGAVAVGLDEEAVLYGRGPEEYDRAPGNYGGGPGNYGESENYGGSRSYDGTANYGRPGDYGSTEGYGRATGDYGRDHDGGNNGNGRRSGGRPGGRHAAKQRG
jgi:putative flippase GtrA